MTTTTSTRTGGEIDTICNRCALNLAHTILAMVGPKVVRVKCNTCGAEHAFKGEQPLMKTQSLAKPRKTASKTTGKPRATRGHAAPVAFEDQFKGKDITRARKYSLKESFTEDEVIDHPTFGLGLVSEVRDNKVDVTFKSGMKTLAHSKGGPGAEALKPALALSKPVAQVSAEKVPAGPSAEELDAAVAMASEDAES